MLYQKTFRNNKPLQSTSKIQNKDTKLIAFLNLNNKNAKKEAQKTPNSQSDSEQKDQYWRYHCP